MRKDRDVAISLRKSGKTYRQISKELGVSLSTLSNWFGREKWSRTIGDALTREHRTKSALRLSYFRAAYRRKLASVYANGRKIAEAEFTELKQDPLFIAALSSYWGEGDKASVYRCRLTNVDPQMIKLFSRFLLEICKVPEERVRYWLLLYPDLDESKCKEYWASAAGIPMANFSKSVYIQGRHKSKRVSYGVCTVTVSSRYLKEKVLVWLRLLADDLAPISTGV
jgi:hypothetical protein